MVVVVWWWWGVMIVVGCGGRNAHDVVVVARQRLIRKRIFVWSAAIVLVICFSVRCEECCDQFCLLCLLKPKALLYVRCS